jgi:DNA-directed RNA polymerase subunit alpha
VNYTVTETRAGARADLDSLRMEVFTDGRIEPQEALQDASRQLMDFLGLFTDGYQGAGAPDARQRGGRPVITDERPVEDLELTVRSYNCLKREGITTVGELVQRSEDDLLEIRNFGQKSIDEVKAKLADLNLGLKQKEF